MDRVGIPLKQEKFMMVNGIKTVGMTQGNILLKRQIIYRNGLMNFLRKMVERGSNSELCDL